MAKLAALVMCGNIKQWHCPHNRIAWALWGPLVGCGRRTVGLKFQRFSVSTSSFLHFVYGQVGDIIGVNILGKKKTKSDGIGTTGDGGDCIAWQGAG